MSNFSSNPNSPFLSCVDNFLNTGFAPSNAVKDFLTSPEIFLYKLSILVFDVLNCSITGPAAGNSFVATSGSVLCNSDDAKFVRKAIIKIPLLIL